MQSKHVPPLGTRYWSALCIASVFGANMGDFCARYLGLGHVKGLPILGIMLVIIFMVESRDQYAHQTYYWLAIIVIRTAATNLADFAAGDMKLDKLAVLAVLTILLVATVVSGRHFASWEAKGMDSKGGASLPTTDYFYWGAMLAAGTLGTVIGDISSFSTGVGTGSASIALCVLLGAWFYFGTGVLRTISGYWFTIVLVRSAGTAVGDFLAGRSLGLGLPTSTLITGMLMAVTLLFWKQRKLEPSPAML